MRAPLAPKPATAPARPPATSRARRAALARGAPRVTPGVASRLARALALALACGVLLAAPTAAAAEIPLDVYLHEVGARFHILPPDINAEVGDTLRLNVINAGATEHDLLVCGEAPKFETTCENVLGRTAKIPPQGSEMLVITLEEPGEFEYYGTGFGEKSADMKGLLHVTGDPPQRGLPLAPGLTLAAVALALLAFGGSRR